MCQRYSKTKTLGDIILIVLKICSSRRVAAPTPAFPSAPYLHTCLRLVLAQVIRNPADARRARSNPPQETDDEDEELCSTNATTGLSSTPTRRHVRRLARPSMGQLLAVPAEGSWSDELDKYESKMTRAQEQLR